MKHIQNERGSALLIVVVIISLLLLSSTILLTTISKNNRYVSSQEKIYKSYYIAEAGIVEGIEYASSQTPTSIEIPPELPTETCPETKNKNKNKNKNKPCKENKESETSTDTSLSNGNGKAKGLCRGGGKSQMKNPHCKGTSETEEDETPQEEEEPTYSLLKEEDKPIFEDNYGSAANVHWIVEKSSNEDIYYVTSTGTYRNTVTTLECAYRFNEENKLEIIYLIEN